MIKVLKKHMARVINNERLWAIVGLNAVALPAFVITIYLWGAIPTLYYANEVMGVVVMSLGTLITGVVLAWCTLLALRGS